METTKKKYHISEKPTAMKKIWSLQFSSEEHTSRSYKEITSIFLCLFFYLSVCLSVSLNI